MKNTYGASGSEKLTTQIKRGLFVGRFQPFHIGHREAIRKIIERVDELVIVVGSSQYSHDLDNPFTAGERITMIRFALDEMGVDPARYYLIPVPDVRMHAVWAAQVIAYTPRFDVVYSNDPLTRRLFKEAGFEVEGTPFYHREIYWATEVRRRMLADENWKELLPKSVAKFIEQAEGVERLRELAKTDTASGRCSQ